jgi:uncharacterized protein
VRKQISVAAIFVVLLAALANAQSWYNGKSFFQLVKTGTPQDIQDAISKGADVNEVGAGYWTPLMVATSPEVISMLLNAGADIKLRESYYGGTSLMWQADMCKDPAVIPMLLKAGADVKDQDKDGLTALMYAARHNRPEVITALIDAGADINARDKKGMTSLMYAAIYNQNPEGIIVLLNAGADARAKDNRGRTALDYAQRPKLVGTDALRQLEEASE